MSNYHSRYYAREYVFFNHSSPCENAENLLHFCNSLPANERDNANSVVHSDDERKRELSPSSPSCNQDDVSLSSSNSSADSKSQFTSVEESNPVISQSSLLDDEKKIYLKVHRSILPHSKTLPNLLCPIYKTDGRKCPALINILLQKICYLLPGYPSTQHILQFTRRIINRH